MILQSLNENAIHGHLTVDLLRKAFSSRDQLRLGWQSLGCEFAHPGLLEALEADIQNALLTAKNAIKVLHRPHDHLVTRIRFSTFWRQRVLLRLILRLPSIIGLL
jgi:hypothetical protein